MPRDDVSLHLQTTRMAKRAVAEFQLPHLARKRAERIRQAVLGAFTEVAELSGDSVPQRVMEDIATRVAVELEGFEAACPGFRSLGGG